MKKNKKILSVLILGCFGLFAFTAEKLYVFKFTEPQINYHWQNLESIKVLMDQSSMPHNQVKQVVAAIDSLQKDLKKVLIIDTSGAVNN
jgi:CMP-2-keto-3-deoxyoctulosonic acid synthetase